MKHADFLNRFQLQLMQPQELDSPVKGETDAAVLVPLVDRPSGLHCIFTVRADHLRHHPGQISFPGGRIEATDQSFLGAALRETQEEIGIDKTLISIHGQLAPLSTISGFHVHPFIGTVSSDYLPQLDTDEVQELFEVPLSFLLDSRNHHIYHYRSATTQYPVYFIPFGQRNIWGLTAAIIRRISTQIYPDGNWSVPL